MKTKIYKGLISIHSHGEADDVFLFLSSLKDPLAKILENDITRRQVTVRYFTTGKECSKEEAQEEFVKSIMGVADCKFISHYSEYTGYLWTDEEINIGGHDLLEELRSNVGKWLILEIDIY